MAKSSRSSAYKSGGRAVSRSGGRSVATAMPDPAVLLHPAFALLLFVLPLIVNPGGYDLYDLPKMTVVRLFVLVGLIVWAALTLRRGRLEMPRMWLALPVGALVVSAVLSTVLGMSTHVSLYGKFDRCEGLLTLLSYVGLFLLLAAVTRRATQLGRLLDALVAGAALVGLYAIAQHYGFDPLGAAAGATGAPGTSAAFEPGRAFATFGNPVFLGAYLVLCLPIAVGRFIEARDDATRWAFGAASAFIMLGLIFTYARAAWAGAVVGLVVLLVVYRRELVNLSFELGLVAAVAVLGIWAASAQPAVVNPSQSLIQERLGSAAAISGSAAGRLGIWQMATGLAARRPLTGFGPDAFRFAFARYKPRDWVMIFRERAVPDKAHNELLQMASTQGMFGFLAYIWLLCAVGWRAVELIRAGQRRRWRRAETDLDDEADGEAELWLEPVDEVTRRRAVLAGSIVAGLAAYTFQLQASFGTVATSPFFWMTLALFMVVAAPARRRISKSRDAAITLPRWSSSTSAVAVIVALLAAGAIWAGAFVVNQQVADGYYARGRQKIEVELWHPASLDFGRAAASAPWEEWYLISQAQALQSGAQAKKDRALLGQALMAYQAASVVNRLEIASYLGEASVFIDYKILFQADSQKDALAMFRKAGAVEPTSASLHFEIASMYTEFGQYAQAVSEWREATYLDPWDVDTYVNLGRSYELTKENDRAAVAYQAALRLDPESAEIQAALERVCR